MIKNISHDFSDENLEAKARWFQSLSLDERMAMLCFYTELIFENNPKVVERKNGELPTRSYRLVTKTPG